MELINTHCVVGAFQCNCHLIVCPHTGKAALIDPGSEPEKILKMIQKVEEEKKIKITIDYLLHTHGHLDHIGATQKMKSHFPSAKIALHRGDEEMYLRLKDQGRLFQMNFEDPAPVDQRLNHEEMISFGNVKLKTIHNPGHSPGSISFQLHEDSDLKSKETLFSGDTLFRESVGRTDLWGADGDLMFKMIRERLLTIEESTIVKPGHGLFSTILHEKRSNPFL